MGGAPWSARMSWTKGPVSMLSGYDSNFLSSLNNLEVLLHLWLHPTKAILPSYTVQLIWHQSQWQLLFWRAAKIFALQKMNITCTGPTVETLSWHHISQSWQKGSFSQKLSVEQMLLVVTISAGIFLPMPLLSIGCHDTVSLLTKIQFKGLFKQLHLLKTFTTTQKSIPDTESAKSLATFLSRGNVLHSKEGEIFCLVEWMNMTRWGLVTP